MSVSTKIPMPISQRAAAFDISALQAPLLFLTATGLYALTIGGTPVRFDEYYTLFAARSWTDSGTFTILDGEYTRARLFTMLVGATFDLFGTSSILIARLPAVIMAGAVITLLFIWLRRQDGVTATATAALVLGMSGYTLEVAHFARFYAPQALTVLGAAMLIYAAAEKTGAALTMRMAAAAALLALGFHLQPTTIIAAAALAIWFILKRGREIWAYLQQHRAFAALAAGVTCGAAALIAPSFLEKYSAAPVWAEAHQYDRLFYLRGFAHQMPALLLLFPIAVVLAFHRNRSLTLLALIMVAATLALHSIAAMKASRYVYYCMPFVALIFGLATAWLAETAVPTSQRLLRRTGFAQSSAVMISWAALLLAGLATLLVNPSYRHTAEAVRQGLMTLREYGTVTAPADPVWDSEAPALRRLIGPRDFLVASDDLRTIAYLRPHDMLINTSHLSDLGTSRDFTKDVRTGRPILGSVAGLDRMIACRASGLIVIDDAHWRTQPGVPSAIADRIEQRAVPVHSAVDHFRIFRWNHRATGACPWTDPEGRPA